MMMNMHDAINQFNSIKSFDDIISYCNARIAHRNESYSQSLINDRSYMIDCAIEYHCDDLIESNLINEDEYEIRFNQYRNQFKFIQ